MISFQLSNFIGGSDYPLFIQYGKHEGNLYMHHHDDYMELVIVIGGTAMHRVNDETYFIKKGDVFVISRDTIHGFEDPVDFELCNIMFKEELLDRFSKGTRQLIGFHGLFMIEPYFNRNESFESRLHLDISTFSSIKQSLDNMLLDYHEHMGGWEDLVLGAFDQLIVRLSRLYTSDHYNYDGAIVLIAKSIAYMESHFKDPLTLESLAGMSHLSVRHFNRLFKAAYKTTPNKYLTHLRLQYACALLKNSDQSITEISYEAGFNNVSYFNRVFKDIYHLTPKKYRQSS